MTLTVLALALLQQMPVASDAGTVPRAVQRALEARSLDRLELTWNAALSREPRDRRALLWMATIDRFRFQYEDADTRYQRIISSGPATADAYTAAAHLGMGAWRALGVDVRRADSLYTLAHAEALAIGESRMAFDASIGLSQVRGRTVGPRAGLELIRQARSELPRPTAEDSAQMQCSEGAQLEQTGDSTGMTQVAHGIAKARRAGAARIEGGCELLLAQSLERRGYLEAAMTHARQALRAFDRANYLVGTALATQWLGYTEAQQGLLASGQLDLERAVDVARQTRFESVEAWAHSGLSGLFITVGDLRSAREHAARAAELHNAHGDLWGLANAWRFEGLIAKTQNRLVDASAKFTDAVAAYRRAGLPYNALEPLRHLAMVEIRRGQLDSAQAVLEEGRSIARTAANPGWMNELPLHLARIAMFRGDLRAADSLLRSADTSFRWRKADSSSIDKLQMATYDAALALRAKRVAVAESAVTYVSLAITQWRHAIADPRLRVGVAQQALWESLGEMQGELVSGLTAAGRLRSAFRFSESVRARELTEASLRRFAAITDSEFATRQRRRLELEPPSVVADLDELRRALRSDEAFVSLTVGYDRTPSTAIVVTRDTAFALTLPSFDGLRPLIERYARVASSGTEPIATGRQLGSALLAPIDRAVPASITRLLISPDGDLFRVPFDVLRLADDRYAAERFVISLAPSATYAVSMRRRPPTTTAKDLVAIADPIVRRAAGTGHPTGPSARSPGATTFASLSLAPLPRSADEARRVAQYGITSRVWTRELATETAVRNADWRGVGVLHMATHAVVDGEGQAQTALALSPSDRDDGFFTAWEMASLKLDGALVVLSACETLGGQVLGGEGLRGLAAPLLEAGARAVVATQWSIGDRSVAPFVDRFYAAMANGENVGDALRTAKLAAIREGARISDWAAFMVIGDASFRPALRPQHLTPLPWVRDPAQRMRDTTGT